MGSTVNHTVILVVPGQGDGGDGRLEREAAGCSFALTRPPFVLHVSVLAWAEHRKPRSNRYPCLLSSKAGIRMVSTSQGGNTG